MLADAGLKPCIWIFGYGSLVWNPGFQFKEKRIGFVKGYQRRFWQGNTYHRGTTGKPGRVATLIPHDEGRTYGVAYKIEGDKQIARALEYLVGRELENGYSLSKTIFTPVEPREPLEDDAEAESCWLSLGGRGFNLTLTSFTPTLNTSRKRRRNSVSEHEPAPSSESDSDDDGDDDDDDYEFDGDVVEVLVYTATEENQLYLGAGMDLVEEARHIVASSGRAGHNLEYVERVGEFMEKHGFRDDYLAGLLEVIAEILFTQNDQYLSKSVVRSKLD